MKLAPNVLKTLQQQKYLEMLPDFQEKKTQAFITLVFTLTTLSVFGIFAISPTFSIITQLQKKLEDSIFVNQKLEEKIKNLAVLQQKYNTLQNDLPVVLSAIPQTPTAPLLIGQIHAIANSNDIVIGRIQAYEVDLIAEQQDTKNNASFTFALDGKGTYTHITNFANDLVNSERIVTIDSLVVSGGLDDTSFSLRGKAYFKK